MPQAFSVAGTCFISPKQNPTETFILQESDREKLHLARQRHAIEEQQADSDALKERRKEERAAKRAARKEAASQQLQEVSGPTASPPGLKNVSRSKVIAGSTSASRYVDLDEASSSAEFAMKTITLAMRVEQSV